MKRINLATAIAAIIFVLALLLGLAARALWIEWGHHKRAHASAEAATPPPGTSATPQPPPDAPDHADPADPAA